MAFGNQRCNRTSATRQKGIVIYIHGYQADNQYFIKSSGPIIQKNDILILKIVNMA